MMSNAFLILGGNLGDRFDYLNRAKAAIEGSLGIIVQASSLYETEPWGFEHDQFFLNQVIKLETALQPAELLRLCKEIEISLGRKRGEERYSARTIDIDILLYNDLVLATPELTIPHPRMANRRFVLEPLAEIAPLLKHPLSQKTMNQLLAECDDTCEVTRLTV